MNWLGDRVQKEVSPTDTVLDLGCGIMQATLDTCPTYPPTRLKCAHITGVDLYEPYLDVLKDETGVTVLRLSIPSQLPVFVDNSYDVVLLNDVLEHLEPTPAALALVEAERIARKKIIINTPIMYDNNEYAMSDTYPYKNLGENELQRHQWLVPADWLKESGYNLTFTKGQIFGVKALPQYINELAEDFLRENEKAALSQYPWRYRVKKLLDKVR